MVSVDVDTAAAGTQRCASCDAPLSGPYCARCGEQTVEPDTLTLRHFLVHTAATELFSIDGTLWRTLRLLFVRPGRLALEYAAGRRRPYVNPFRLLLISIVVYVVMTMGSSFGVTLEFGPVILSVSPPTIARGRPVADAIAQMDRYKLLARRVEEKRTHLENARVRERFHERLAAFVQPASFTNVFLFAVTLHAVFRRQRHRFLEHVAFSMQFISFVLLSSFVAFAAVRLRHWLGPSVYLAIFLTAVWHFAYLAVAIRRFYLARLRWTGWVLSVAAALLLYILNSAFITAVQVAGAAIALALA